MASRARLREAELETAHELLRSTNPSARFDVELVLCDITNVGMSRTGVHPATSFVMRDADARFPQWWSEQIQAAWNRSRAAALDDWRVRGDHSSPIDTAILEEALAFGHGARSAYSHQTSWEAVCSQLRADWIHLGHLEAAAWERVVDAIRHEWLRAAGPGGDAAPAP